ncbi:DegT/DnrJ/EryC1/StrS family aminotransferase [Pontibacter sp. E15-1]|uniref:DegT/DnrJ/EryC1/StrS family aminotransferase n=1 Tax=Pontibacter sp. E15-1 TaxID=2919918 RepID=UPI001F50284C|nr:DegT/DnrJ/EryC1/StrS family aminotransferase [Pontibacter sp. E15-1]MCJ8166397.1 DegT/DnrJ/EryC1/StrS family aminotransferase [Pontibacter sp. E15-1]
MKKIPFVDLRAQYLTIKGSVDAAIAEVLHETSFIGGKHVKEFEKNFAELYGVNHCISCANGTDAIYIVLKMLGVGPGDEVITTACSWISTSETISQAGAKPVFVDIEPDYFTIDPARIEEKITKKTKAIIPVHLYGQMAQMDIICDIADRHGLHVIEDCAQSHFSELNLRRAGTYGIASTFSFYPGKNLGAYGDAGCILTNDEQLALNCRMYANHGALVKHQHQMEGINSRLDGLQAAILNAKLSYILEWTEKRNMVSGWYLKSLKGVKQVALPVIRPNAMHSFHLFVIRAERREELIKYLSENGVETAIHYPVPLPFMEAYNYLCHTLEDFPVSRDYQSSILSLPIYPEISEEQVTYVCGLIKLFYS